ncbi:3-deoxy-D-manno-octulosonic acid transferase [Thiomicrorhabdus immobilis]|uniref:3-deoxy-D-manno-octulosonic acid transferase n=1 Tax=Thiomicrorhabdus immobilis TaxID=2791037 RepID=A0ABN6CUN7_9GAMM|nr:lipid IV(A) 3-deoxy-D-manno-octulosonic acid transferase [Thiomicrorhabdus immobilis]BCN92676.1 3-deoxy-D-manno-octulosonic acid transferase [Thiomicrorhabdus immobilis]
MNLFSYRLLTFLAMPLIAYSGWKRCRKHQKQQQHDNSLPDIHDCFKSRFGFNSTAYQTGGVWIHAVSVGETRSIFPLLSRLHQQYPELPLTVTNGSTQGALQALQFSPVTIQHQMLPYDYPFAVKRFLQQIQPKLVIMVETEIWPNLYQACVDNNIPIVLINARLKTASFNAYQKWGGQLIRDALNQTEFIAAQFPADAEHFKTLGANQNKVKTLGNLKFDLTIADDLAEQAHIWKQQNHLNQRPIWVAASTHAHPENGDLMASEEQLMLDAHKKLLQTHPNALLILVPRHADRFQKVTELLESKPLNWQQRSQDAEIQPDTQVYLADSVGELMLWFAVSDIAFIGGSMVPFGGHNILEPAALNKPVLSGPHYQNLQALFDPFVAENGVKIVDDSHQLAATLEQLLTHKEQATKLANQGHQCFAKQTGALERTMQALKPYLDA